MTRIFFDKGGYQKLFPFKIFAQLMLSLLKQGLPCLYQIVHTAFIILKTLILFLKCCSSAMSITSMDVY